MKKIITQKELNNMIEEMNQKYLHKKPNKEGELDLIFVELFNADTEEAMLSNLLDFNSNYEEKHYIHKVAFDTYMHNKFAMPKDSKKNKIKTAVIQCILLLKYKYNHTSLRQMNKECSSEFQEIFGLYYDGEFKEHCTYHFQDEDIKNEEWSEERMKKAGFDEFTIMRIKKKQEEEEISPTEEEIHGYIEADGLFYDIEHFNGVEYPTDLRRVKEIMLKEKIYE